MKRILLILYVLMCPAATARAQVTQSSPDCMGVNDTAVLAAALANIGSTNQGVIQLPNKKKIRCVVDTLTIPANVTLDNTVGSGIEVSTGQTLTILGPIQNPQGKQIFYHALSGQGTVSLAGSLSVSEVYPRWWGAAADGSTEDSAATQAALLAGAGRAVYFSAGTYIVQKLNVYAGTLVTGPGLVKLKGGLTAKAVIFNVVGSHVTFRDLNIDGNKSSLSTAPVPGYAECECYENDSLAGAGSAFWAGIRADGVVTPGITDLVVEGCSFTNMFGSSVVTIAVDRPRVESNITKDSYRSMADLYGGNAAGTAWGRTR